MDKATEKREASVEEKLSALYELQLVHSEADKIVILRGELPLEVEDLEDEIQGLDTRIANYRSEVDALREAINGKKIEIKDSQSQIKKYEKDQDKVRNNREYEAIVKEVEYEQLQISLFEKRIKEFNVKLAEKEKQIEKSEELLGERHKDLTAKKDELDAIIRETQKDEDSLNTKALTLERVIDDRLLNAYKRIRKSVRNGLAVVSVKRGACGGCFNKIPPQRQLDVQTHKKIIVCEYCGRVLVDENTFGNTEQNN
ncbi:MAG: hypothetical protein RIS47_1546 [Bacteroidota bacterium]|jgi:predicted  nucleic acid-binding Zn-ribbon protein